MKRLWFIRFVLGLLVAFSANMVSAQQVSTLIPSVQSRTDKVSSNYKVTLDIRDVTLASAIETLANRAGLKVVYADNKIPKKFVSLKVQNVHVVDAAARILRGTGLVAKIDDSGLLKIVEAPLARQSGKTQGVISGKVIDGKTGKGISGANVSLGSDTRGVVTDDNGMYRISGVSAGTHILAVRLLGYAKQTRSVTVGEGATVNVDFKLEPSANVLDQVVVTGTVTSTELRAVPNAITVVTAKQIEERGITRIDQLFRGDIPGLFSLNMGSVSPLNEVTMYSRGATALTATSAGTAYGTNPIKTYIDGVEMADPKYLSQIDPSSIERIEILTGPQASTIYGSNAINGVMQIFTKRGSGNRPKLTLSLNSGVTQNDFSSAVAPNHLADANVTGTEGRVSYNVGGSWNYVGAWTPGKQTQRLSAYGSGRMDVGRLAADMSARQGLTKTKENGNVSQGETDLYATGIWLPYAFQGLPEPKTRSLNGRTVGLSLSYRPLSWWSHDIVLGSDAYEMQYLETAPGFGGSTGADTTLYIQSGTTVRRSERYSSTVQLPVSSGARLNLTFGGDHWRTGSSLWFANPLSLTGSFSSANVIRSRPDKNRGAFVQGQLALFDDLFFTYGVRADWNPNFGEDVKVKPGRYGLSYTRDIETPLGSLSTKLRGSYGRSIRPPAIGAALTTTAVSQFGSVSSIITRFGNFDYIKANPDLGPEHQQGGEGGIELYLGSRGSLVVTRFNQTVDNLILLVDRVDSARSLFPVAPSASRCQRSLSGTIFDDEGYCFRYQFQNLNVGSIRNQGWEMQGSVNLGPITTRGTYSWVKSRVIGITPRYRALLQATNPEIQPGSPFNFIPEHTWALEFAYAASNSTVSLSVNGVGMRYVSNDALGLAVSTSSRFDIIRPRIDLVGYRPLDSGYATADLNATHRFSSRVDAVLQVLNLTDYYQNDFSANYASPGRSSSVGVRLHW